MTRPTRLNPELDQAAAAVVFPRAETLAINVKQFGATGDGVTDDTSEIDAAWAWTSSRGGHLFFPAGTYVYNGTGFTPGTGASPFIYGAGQGVTTIRLAANQYLLAVTSTLNSLVLKDLKILGGAGAVHSTYASDNVAQVFSFRNVYFDGYTKAAVSHNSTDMPYWLFEACVFRAANDTTTMGVALSGDTSGASFVNCAFLKNRVHVKLGGNAPSAGPATYFYGCDFIRYSAYQGTPRTSIWVVPSPGGLTTYAGTGYTVTKCKFGKENLASQDFHVLYADQDSDTTDNATRWPVLDTASTGFVNHHHYRDCQFSGGTLDPAPAFITSTANDLYAFHLQDIAVQHAWPPYVVDFLFPGTDSHRNRNSVIRMAARDFGANANVAHFLPSANRICNVPDWARLEDPTDRVVYTDTQFTRTGGGDLAEFVDLLPGVQATDFTGFAGASLTGTTDVFGGVDAAEVTFTAGSRAYFNLTTAGLVQPGQPVWLEFDLAPGASAPLDDIQAQIIENSIVNVVRLCPVPGVWRRFRILAVPRAQNFDTIVFLAPNTSTAGSVKVGRIRMYHAREPVSTDGRFPGMVVAPKGLVTAYRASGTATDTDVPVPLDGALQVIGTDLVFRGNGAWRGVAPRTTSGATPVGKGELFINVKDHGVTGDGATNDTAAINDLIADVSAQTPGGACLYFPPGDYLVGGIVLASGIYLTGMRPHYGYLASGKAWTTRFKATGAVDAVVTAGVSQIANAGVQGIDFDGRGLASKGVYWPTATWCTIRDVHMNNFLDPFIQIDAGQACRITNFLGVNGLMNPTRASNAGSIQIGGNDHWLSCIETGGGYVPGDLTAGLYNSALYLTGTSIFVDAVVAELSEVGVRIGSTSRGSRFQNTRADRNGTHGWAVDGGKNTFTGCHASSNAREADDTYMGFTAGATATGNAFAACSVTANVGENLAKFGFEDTQNGQVQSVRNSYSACRGDYATALFSTNPFAGSAPSVPNHPVRHPDGTTIPDVSNASLVYLGHYTTATTVTDFSNGCVGQVLTVIGNTNVTIADGGTVKTSTGANKVLAANVVYRFTSYNGVWYEDAGA